MVGVQVMRCQGCRSIDWFRDGYRIFGGADGEVLRRRAAPADPAADRDPWYCVGCDYRAEHETPVGEALSDIQRALRATRRGGGSPSEQTQRPDRASRRA